MTGQTDGSGDAGALRDLLTDHRGDVDPVFAQHFDEVLEHWDGRTTTAAEVSRNLAMLRAQLGLPPQG